MPYSVTSDENNEGGCCVWCTTAIQLRPTGLLCLGLLSICVSTVLCTTDILTFSNFLSAMICYLQSKIQYPILWCLKAWGLRLVYHHHQVEPILTTNRRNWIYNTTSLTNLVIYLLKFCNTVLSSPKNALLTYWVPSYSLSMPLVPAIFVFPEN